MTDEEKAILSDLVFEKREIEARSTIVRRNEELDISLLCMSGIVSRQRDDRKGRRQLLSLHFPGDFLDLHAYPLKYLDHDVGALSDVTLAVFKHADLRQLQYDHPDLTRKLWFATLLDAAVHRQWIWRIGTLRAVARVAHFFAECHARLVGIGIADKSTFDLALKQTDIAEVVGITAIHTNRVLRELREREVAYFKDGTVEIADLKELWKLAEFEPSYLYLDDQALARIWSGEAVS
ncbi:Crp/Fnr family transcriptional regulator [Notoacmeibacter marinus]|uniref:Crp/Fnr family transcriptional regulator n=1 Tax=Notoacmeibacter marinus TaxID=1876515 RepID=UPI0019D46192|nr:Crp/Fnr family transcriptional regulator [Notoacmeibacter marinus]